MVIVDTTVWVDYLRGVRSAQTNWLDSELTMQRLGLLDLILCEVLQGIRVESQFEATLETLLKFEVYQTGGTELAIEAARNYQRLLRRGFTVRKTIDCWIATFCLLNGHSLLHSDKDFEPFEKFLGLTVIHPEPSTS